MVLVQSQFDSLPYIDSLEEADLERARALIQAEAKEPRGALHPSLSAQPAPHAFTGPLVEAQMALFAEGATSMTGGVDTSRYTDLSRADDPSKLDVEKAAVALRYSQLRQENLALIAEFGKNQWLIGNDLLERQLGSVESQLQVERRAIEQLNGVRKRKQTDAEPALTYLEGRWRQGIRNLVDVNLACLKLEREVKQARRE